MKNAIVIGLGSMGKRRIRCLNAIGINSITGIDPRADRRQEATQLYGIESAWPLSDKLLQSTDYVLICTPPDQHHDYMNKAVELQKPFFVEASVVSDGLEEIAMKCRALNIVAAPSATLLFHPATKYISQLVSSGVLGLINLITYHSGQYLPDWHTYEQISDYYVSNPLTGGAREIVPFELAWLTRIIGHPQKLVAFVSNSGILTDAPAIDDTYLLSFSSEKCNNISIAVDVISREAQRRLVISGSTGFLRWDWNDGYVHFYNAVTAAEINWEYDLGQSASGYNSNIGEQMYIDEVASFIESAEGGAPFPNTLEQDIVMLKILQSAEKSSSEGRILNFQDKW